MTPFHDPLRMIPQMISDHQDKNEIGDNDDYFNKT